jgi:hypothetical protein
MVENNYSSVVLDDGRYCYTSKEVLGDKDAFDMKIIQPDGTVLEQRVLTMGEVKD